MASTKKLSIICYGITFLIFLVILLYGKRGLGSGDEMGYTLLNFYFIMPFTSFVMALVLGVTNAYMKWLYPFVFGALAFVIPYFVFGTTGMFSLFFALMPALIGLGIGFLIWMFRSKK